jgi:hypothetical protein
MGAFLSGRAFGKQAALRIGLFVGLTLAFPFFVFGIVHASGARAAAGGAAGALALVLGFYLKPLLVLGFIASMIRPSWRRMRSLGLPAWWGLLVPVLFLIDAPFLLVVGAHWSVAFSFGFLHLGAPIFALCGLVLVVVMSFAMPSSDADPPGLARFGWAGKATTLFALIILASVSANFAVYVWIWFATFGQNLTPSVQSTLLIMIKFGSWIVLIQTIACVCLSGLFAYLAYLSRRSGSDAAPPAGSVFTNTGSMANMGATRGHSPRQSFGMRAKSAR